MKLKIGDMTAAAKEYFFKSQESLATVIDNEDEEDEEERTDETDECEAEQQQEQQTSTKAADKEKAKTP